MSVFSMKTYYPSNKRNNSSLLSSHHKTFSYLHNTNTNKPLMTPPSSTAYTNLRNKLISLDLTYSKKSYFTDFFQDFKTKSSKISHLTTQQSSSKQSNTIPQPKFLQTQASSNSSTSKSSIRLYSQPDKHCKTNEKVDYFAQRAYNEGHFVNNEFSTQRKFNRNSKTLENENKLMKKIDQSFNDHKKTCLNHPDKKGKFRKMSGRFYESDLFCSECAMRLINKGIKIEDSERVFRSQIEGLLEDLSQLKPCVKSQKEGLKMKKNDISKFYENQISKIQGFYQSLSQRLEAEKLSVLRSFVNHKERAMEIYQSFEKEMENEEKDFMNLEENLMREEDVDLESLTLKTQEKLISMRLAMSSRNKEFLSVYRTSGINEKRLISIKNQLFPLFELVQIPTSILKRHVNSETQRKINNEACFSFENKGKNEVSLKFKNILEKIKKNQAKNQKFYMPEGKKEEEYEAPMRKLFKAKSLPSFHRKSNNFKINGEEPYSTFYENRPDESHNTSNTSEQANVQKTLFYSPNFKEI